MAEGKMRTGILLTLALVIIGLAPFALVQAFPSPHSFNASMVRFPTGKREKISVVWCSNIGLAKIHMWQREMSPAERKIYDLVVPGLRKTYFCPLGRVYCGVTGQDKFRMF